MAGSILRNRDGCESRCRDQKYENCVFHSHSPQGVARDGASDVSARSVGNVAGCHFREKAPHWESVWVDSRLSLPWGDEKSIVC
jgi:hypothetical protein